MAALAQDLRHALRSLARTPAFTAIAVVTLALGIGGTTAIFSVVHAVLLEPLPYKDPDRLALVWTSSEKIGLSQNWVSEPEVLDLRQNATKLSGLGVLSGRSANLTGTEDPEQIDVGQVSAGFFDLLGVPAWRGRSFAPGEDAPGAGKLALLSHGFWQRRFGADEGVIGKTVELDGEAYTVLGILPPGFRLYLPPEAHGPTQAEMYVPYAVDYSKEDRLSHGLTVFARLAPGATLEQAQAELDALAARLRPQYYEATGFDFHVVSLHRDVVEHVRPALWTLLGAVLFVLLIACANVANLLLARGVRRRRELTIRAALGAGRLRLVRQLLTESLVLAVAGGGLGVLLSMWGVNGLLALGPADLPRLEAVGIDPSVLGFTLCLSLLTGVVFGLIPTLQASKPDLNETLKEGGAKGAAADRRGGWARDLVVVGEVALSLGLLVGAGLLLRSFVLLQHVEPGFRPQSLLTFEMTLPRSRYSKPEQVAAFYQDLLGRLRGLPGVVSAGAMMGLPLTDFYWSGTFTFDGVPATSGPGPLESFEVSQRIVTAGLFETLGATLVSGRSFTPEDKEGAPEVVIVDETLARRVWPGQDPIGKRLGEGGNSDKPHWFEVVGVVRPIHQDSLSAAGREQAYFPHAQRRARFMTVVIRAAGDPLDLAPAVRARVRAMDRDQPIHGMRTMDQVVAGSLAQMRFTLMLAAMFAALAVVLATIGIYGVVAYSVKQRNHEIAVRMALGAQARDVLGLVLRHGARLAGAGIAFGVAGALVLSRLISSQLFGVSPTDPLTFAVVSLGLAGAALAACALPARRASKIDPMEALRYE
jgi:putative ABC transport system permease protein